MLDQVDDRILEISTILVVMMTIFMCICYYSIFTNPYVAVNPFKPPTETPWKIVVGPQPTFPSTWTPTATNIPTEKPTATNTPTVTNTPTPTATSTPFPSPTPTVTPTSPPTATPVNTPTPTPTSAPRYTLDPAHPPEPITHCDYTEIRVHVSDFDSLPKSGIGVRIWNEALGFNVTVTTDVLGYAAKRIGDREYFDTTWYIQLLEGGVPASEVKNVATSSECCDNGKKTCGGKPTVWTLWFKATSR